MRLSGRRRAQTAPLIASLILAASLALSGCRAGVTSPVPSSQPVLPTEAAPFWVERPYNPGIEQELRCLGAATYSQLIRYSPSGEWTIHPTIDGQGSMCLTKRGSLVHKILFTYTAAVLDLRQLGYTFVDIPKRPYTYFWAGDGSGVYLYYPEIRQFYFVTVPEGVLTRLNYPVFIPSASRWVEIFGSPAGTSDLVVEALLMAGTEVLIALVLGSWRFWWLLLVIAWALFAPVLVGASLDNRNSGEARWPRMIRLPAWFQKLRLS